MSRGARGRIFAISEGFMEIHEIYIKSWNFMEIMRFQIMSLRGGGHRPVRVVLSPQERFDKAGQMLERGTLVSSDAETQ